MAAAPPTISKEQKQLDASIDMTIQRLTDVKNALQAFLFKLENEALTWTSFNDSFALVSSHLTILNKSMKSEKTAPFRSYGLLPLVLCQDLDTELQRATEGRVPTFNHEVVPHHLRTKPEPEVETKEESLTRRIFNTSLEAGNKQMNSFKRFVENILDTVTNIATSMDNHMSDRNMGSLPTHSTMDTQQLMAAMTTGKGLKPLRGPGSGASTPSGHHGSPQPSSSSPTPSMMASSAASSSGGTSTLSNKMTSSVKTNLKAASNHPYSRN